MRAKQLNVRVLGTGFNVMAYKGDARTEVTLVNGKVDVTKGDVSEILTPNSQFVVDNESGKCRTRMVNVSTYVDWKKWFAEF